MHAILNNLNIARRTQQFYSLWVFSNIKILYYIFNLHFYCMTNFQVCNAMHNRGRVFFSVNFCLHILLFISFCLSLYFSLSYFLLLNSRDVFSKCLHYLFFKYQVSYNKSVLNERKSEQVHQPHASLFLNNAINIA